MKHKHLHLIILALGTLLAALTRFWNRSAAVDNHALFVSSHPSIAVLVVLSLLFVLAFLVLSIRSPGRSPEHQILTYSPIQAVLALASALLTALAALSMLPGSNSTFTLILTVLGLGAALCMARISRLRLRGKSVPGFELLPIGYLLIKLIFNFKSWSTDPIILDYCCMLFALIFSLLAFYGIAGFCFDQGKPRKTLFCASCGIFFSAMAAVDGIMTGSLSAVLSYLGFILWLWPSVSCLLHPHKAPSKPEPGTSPEKTNE